MNKIIIMIEDLWVQVAFAEAGAYQSLEKNGDQPWSMKATRIYAA
jgi:hypothetical protein